MIGGVKKSLKRLKYWRNRIEKYSRKNRKGILKGGASAPNKFYDFGCYKEIMKIKSGDLDLDKTTILKKSLNSKDYKLIKLFLYNIETELESEVTAKNIDDYFSSDPEFKEFLLTKLNRKK